MLIVYGTKGFTKQLGTIEVEHSCPRCQQIMRPMHARVMRWFTLYWIPLIPYSFKHYLVCPHCGNNVEVSKETIRNLSRQG